MAECDSKCGDGATEHIKNSSGATEHNESTPAPYFVVAPQAPSEDRTAKVISCFICAQTFHTQQALRTHEAHHHAGEFRCWSCNKSSFKSTRDLRKHSRSTGHRISVDYKILAETSGEAISAASSSCRIPVEDDGVLNAMD